MLNYISYWIYFTVCELDLDGRMTITSTVLFGPAD